METVEGVVIVGAGLAGLATALGLHRLGVRSLVLESSDTLRASGFAFTTWTNAWRALDALGIGESIRQRHVRLEGLVASASTSGDVTSQLSLMRQGKRGEHEVRCVRRSLLLEALERELPNGSIRYSSKVVSVEEVGNLKFLHLADGSTVEAKVLVGCDGVNSLVSRWLGLKKPSFTGRSASRGFAEFPNEHGFPPKFLQFAGQGFRFGLLPCDEKSVYWFFTWTPSTQEKEVEHNAVKMREYVISKLTSTKVPQQVIEVVEKSELSDVVSSPLRYRWSFELLGANISKGNVCVAGDALHPMTPDIGQGGCSALEDAVVLAKCLGDALSEHGGGKRDQYDRVKLGLDKYSKERRWRSFTLIATAYMVGLVQESDGALMGLFRDKFLSGFLAKMLLKRADFDCGKL